MAWMLRTTLPPDQQESGGLCINTSTTLYRASDKTPLPTPAPPLWQCNWLWLPRNEPGATMLIAHLRPMESFPAMSDVQAFNLSKCVLTKSGCPNGVPRTLMPRRCESNSSEPLQTMAVGSARPPFPNRRTQGGSHQSDSTLGFFPGALGSPPLSKKPLRELCEPRALVRAWTLCMSSKNAIRTSPSSNWDCTRAKAECWPRERSKGINALFAAFSLQNCVRPSRGILPQVTGRGAVKHRHEWQC